MTVTHVLSTPSIARPWWPTHQRFPQAPITVLTDCCCCRMRRSDTVARLVTTYDPPLGGFGCYQKPAADWQEKEGPWAKADIPTGAYYAPRVEIECAPQKGCKLNPRRRWGKHLREMWRWS
jgi:hypothetical protein